MVSTELIRTIVGIMGNIISLVLFLSPVPTFITILKNRDVERFSPVPYIATLLNCYLWVLYGLPVVHPDSTLVLTINGAGVAIELAYVIMFVLFAPPTKKVQVTLLFLAETAFVLVFGALVITLLHTTDSRSLIVGILCIIVCIIMYISPLAVMKLVIQTKSIEYMPLYLSLASFGNGTCWTIYALLKFDVNILVPNGIGLVFAVTQLTLYSIYYKSTQRILANRKKGEVGLTSIVVCGESNKVGRPHIEGISSDRLV